MSQYNDSYIYIYIKKHLSNICSTILKKLINTINTCDTIFYMDTNLLQDIHICISVLIIVLFWLQCGQIIPEHFTYCVDRPLQSKLISERNLFAKCEHSLKFSWKKRYLLKKRVALQLMILTIAQINFLPS